MCLSVLDAEFALGVASDAFDLEIGVALIFEHLLYDLEHRLVLKDLAIG
jgi:hypothetical protein